MAAGGLGVLALIAALSALIGERREDTALGVPQAVILGAVEGITEYLPVSSTGHLVVTQRLLGLEGSYAPDSTAGEALDSYAVVIQGGAILAVGWLFRRRLLNAARAFRPRAPAADRRVALAIVVSATPAGILGLLVGDTIKDRLFAPAPIAMAWIAGGLVLLGVAGWLRRQADSGTGRGVPLEAITWRMALVVGLVQSLALWPGMSRSLVTIVGGCLAGLALRAAVELSFLVGFVVLLAASAYELLGEGGNIAAAFGWVNPLIGFVVAFVCAVVSIRWLLAILSGRSLAGFGWYRLAIGATTFGLLATGSI